MLLKIPNVMNQMNLAAASSGTLRTSVLMTRDERQARSMLELDSTGSYQFLGFGLPGVDNEHEWLSLVSGRVLIKPGRIPS